MEVSGIQLTATVLAAVTGALLASSLGVVGTITGTAVASAASTLGTAVYRHYLGRTRERIRDVAPVIVRQARWRPSAGTGANAPARVYDQIDVVDVPVDRSGRRRVWRRYGVPALAAFVLVLACITGFELAAGKPISSLVWGKSGNGTSIGSLFSGNGTSTKTPVDPTSSPTSGASSSPTRQASPEPSSSSSAPATSTAGPTQSATSAPSEPAPAASNAAATAG